jgi:hypothetical protein
MSRRFRDTIGPPGTAALILARLRTRDSAALIWSPASPQPERNTGGRARLQLRSHIQDAATAGVLEFVARAGADVEGVVRSANLTLAELQQPQARLPLRKLVTLIEAASGATGDATLASVCAPGIERCLSDQRQREGVADDAA